ncbi:hypothetical protein [Sinorhizobium meliloti]|uniref:hypothetical protein n=1 Tax=Rhizobium meliloti TaxID=382 RepID=UPI00129719D0|nr:hypothetical protein [Sinorhizobium meliloti]MQX28991.1 hypothetical protein [Sinorhizobium meliloti]
MSTMVERVARAIADHFTNGNEQYDDLSEYERITYVASARAAIEAMEPTGFIEEAGWQKLRSMLSEDWLSLDEVGEVFKAMIQAALKEQA